MNAIWKGESIESEKVDENSGDDEEVENQDN